MAQIDVTAMQRYVRSHSRSRHCAAVVNVTTLTPPSGKSRLLVNGAVSCRQILIIAKRTHVAKPAIRRGSFARPFKMGQDRNDRGCCEETAIVALQARQSRSYDFKKNRAPHRNDLIGHIAG